MDADGAWRDEPVVLCEDGPNTLVTKRKQQDLPMFCKPTVVCFADAAAHTHAV
jgi:protease I